MFPLLQINNLTTAYGEHCVLQDLHLTVHTGEIVMIVGANGAGKSTLLKAIFGLVEDMRGEVLVENMPVIPHPHRMVELGICFVPQDNRVFPEMSVEENIRLGGYILGSKKDVAERLAQMYELFPHIRNKRKLLGSALSGGEKQMVALARSLMLRPKLLLLDEPSLGLAPKIVSDVFATIQHINRQLNTAIVVVEHNLKSLLQIAHRAVILAQGQVVKEGKPSELLHSKILEEVFFGSLA